jgi:hypothetical protein
MNTALHATVYNFSRAAAFYQRAFEILALAEIPFLIGGAFAQSRHTRRDRDTKDLDIVVRRADINAVLDAFSAAGFRTELPYPHWLGKVHDGDRYLDVLFGSGNGVVQVDDEWFTYAVKAEVLGTTQLVCPAEEHLWSKAFVQERERFDGADVMHLLHACAPRLDWDRLLARFGDNWPVLLSHVVLFQFAYPDRREDIPGWVIDELTRRLRCQKAARDEHVCHGTVLSREQYLFDVTELGYADARVEPNGNMTPEEAKIWTDAIER